MINGFEVNYSPVTVITKPGEKVEIGRLPSAQSDPKLRDIDGVAYDSLQYKNGVIIAPEYPGHYSLSSMSNLSALLKSLKTCLISR